MLKHHAAAAAAQPSRVFVSSRTYNRIIIVATINIAEKLDAIWLPTMRPTVNWRGTPNIEYKR